MLALKGGASCTQVLAEMVVLKLQAQPQAAARSDSAGRAMSSVMYEVCYNAVACCCIRRS